MADLPWSSYSAAVPGRDYVALLSYLPLRSVWGIPRLLLDMVRILRQLRTSPGLIGYSMRAQLAAKRFWTLSAWEDETALHDFVAAPPHVAAMRALARHMGPTDFTRWTVQGSGLPLDWDEALSRSGCTGQAKNDAR